MSEEAMQIREASPDYLADAEQSDVPSGFKKTEIGLIPEEWVCVRVTDIARLESGHTPSKTKPAYWGGTVPWVSLHDTESLDGPEISVTAQTITDEGLANSSARLLPEGTVIFSRTATVGKATILGSRMATSQDFANYICSPQLHNLFLVYLFRSMKAVWQSFMAGSIHNTIYMPVFKSLKIALPPISEQHAIAEALSDVDNLIGALDTLIAKQRAIKQATMQQLLTGKTRLPGFGGEWETKRLGDHVTFLRNGVNSRAELTLDGYVKYLHYGDIHTSDKVYLDPSSSPMPYLPEDRARTLDRLRVGDLVFADASEDMDSVGKSIEIARVGKNEVVAGLHTIAARFDKTVLADGFKAYLQFCPSFIEQLRRLAAGTKVYATNRSHIASVEMKLPGTKEQTAIANILSDMDAEIIALEERRDKTLALKQGMMQQLLTGKIRLVDSTPKEGANG